MDTDKTTHSDDVVETTEGGSHSAEGRSDIDNETEGEPDNYDTEQVNDSVDTAEGGSHRIGGGPDIDNETREESETDET